MSFIPVFPLESDEQRQDFREHVLLCLQNQTCIPRRHLKRFVEIFDDGRACAALGGTHYRSDGRIALPNGKVVKPVPQEDERLISMFGLVGAEIDSDLRLRFIGCCPDCGSQQLRYESLTAKKA